MTSFSHITDKFFEIYQKEYEDGTLIVDFFSALVSFSCVLIANAECPKKREFMRKIFIDHLEKTEAFALENQDCVGNA